MAPKVIPAIRHRQNLAQSMGAALMRVRTRRYVLHKLISHLRRTTFQAAPPGPATPLYRMHARRPGLHRRLNSRVPGERMPPLPDLLPFR